MTFDELGLHSKIVEAVFESGYTEPTKIQAMAIPAVLEGADIRASAQTGTGKTAAFLLPALQCLMKPSKEKFKGPRVLILAPTRELAMQIDTQAKKYSNYIKQIKTVCIMGGVPYPVQKRKMSRPYDILIATPGRLIDYIDRRKINLSQVEMLVLDEADRMLDMGFIEPVKKIADTTPETRQTLLFSATMEGSVYKLSQQLLKNPKEIIVHSKQEKHENIEQKLHYADDINHKNLLLDKILEESEYSIIFTSTKRHADVLSKELRDKGHSAGVLHGDMTQGRRSKTIAQLKRGQITTLVATDVAARGIDVSSITHVVNFDLPRNIEDYVHRIGRTGRAGASGTAISLVGAKDAPLVKRIEKFTGQEISVETIPGLEPKRGKSHEPKGARGPKRGPRGPKRWKGPKKAKGPRLLSPRGRNARSSPRKYSHK